MPIDPTSSLGLVPDGANALLMVLVTLALCLVAGVLLARFGPDGALLGLVRLSLSQFIAPFVYLWKSAAEVGRYGRNGDGELRGSDQYLLGHVYLYILAVVISISVLWVASVVTAVVFALLPPTGSGQALAEATKAANAARTELEDAERLLTEQKTSGAQRLVAEAERKQREAKDALGRSESAFRAARERIVERDSLNVDAIDRLESELEQKAGWGADTDSLRRGVASSFAANASLDPTDKAQLSTWLEAWAGRLKARGVLAAVSESSAAEQAKELLAEAEARVSAAREELDAAVSEQQQKERAREPRWGIAGDRLLVGAAFLLGGVWLFGLLAESWALLLRLAADVRAMRNDTRRPGSRNDSRTAGTPGSESGARNDSGGLLGLSAP